MPPRTPLTPEQRSTVCHPGRKLVVVAPPGCGKTSIAAERFGLIRFDSIHDNRRCLALSFTRAATRELKDRIRNRWGPSALSWPHQARTLDSLHVEILESLLRAGAIQWPSKTTSLTVEDSWRGFTGARYVKPGTWVPTPTLKQGVVAIESRRHRGIAVTRVGKVSDLRQHFDADRCTHLEVREILALAVADPDVTRMVADYLSKTSRAIVVDEVFDANELDVAILEIAAAVGSDVFAVGDPWQAVYEFRGADPRSVARGLKAAGFDGANVTTSFRFRTNEMRSLVADLRSRQPSPIVAAAPDTCDVVLSTEWESLWACDPTVLPLSFGIVRNQTDAAILLILDEVVRRRLGMKAVYADDAHAFLRTADVDRSQLRDAAGRLIERLSGGGGDRAALLAGWREDLRKLGVPAQLRRLKAAKEKDAVARLDAVATRLATSRSIPGMTVHQAKGGEWPAVGLRLTAEQAAAFDAGLNPNLEEHRVLYVAATRAMNEVFSV